jgi:hypothetical protein
MRRGFCLLLGLLVLSCSLAWGAPGGAPREFRGLIWGMAPPGTLVKNDAAGTGGTVEVYRNRTKELQPFLGVPVADEAYYFAHGKLTGGQLFCRGEDSFNRLKDSLFKLYGAPKNPKPESYTWEWPGTQALLMITYNKKFQFTTLSMTSGADSPVVTPAKKSTH